MINKLCFRCQKYINDEEHYYKIVEYLKGKSVKEDFVHKQCWDDFLKRVSDTKEAMGMLRGLKTSLTKIGMLPPEEYEVTP